MLSISLDTSDLKAEPTELDFEINIVAEIVNNCIHENAHKTFDQAESNQQYDSMVVRFDKAKARQVESENEIAKKTARRYRVGTYLDELRKKKILSEFREEDWLIMIDFITINSKDDIVVTFKDRTEIKT